MKLADDLSGYTVERLDSAHSTSTLIHRVVLERMQGGRL